VPEGISGEQAVETNNRRLAGHPLGSSIRSFCRKRDVRRFQAGNSAKNGNGIRRVADVKKYRAEFARWVHTDSRAEEFKQYRLAT
jgi:hypothetical protein